MEFSLTVLSYKLEVLLLFLFPSEDRIYTDSRRIKPNSRSSLLSEQLNPSKLLHLEDEKSRPFFFIYIISKQAEMSEIFSYINKDSKLFILTYH